MTETPNTPAGWYPTDDGTQRYWDGEKWTDHTAPATAPAAPPQVVYVEKKSGKGCLWAALITFGVIAVIGVVAVVIFVFAVGSAVKTVTNEVTKGHDVTYVVTGTATRADLTYTTDGLTSTEQASGAKVPWRKTIHIAGNVFNVYQLQAQNQGSGTITCEILVDGKSKTTVTSTGVGAIASCDYNR